MDDHRGVLAAPLDLERLAGVEASLRFFVFGEVRLDPPEVLADGDPEALDRIALADEPRVVLRVVLRGFGWPVAQAMVELGADEVVVGDLARLDRLVDRGVEIAALAGQSGHETEGIYAPPPRLHLPPGHPRLLPPPPDPPVRPQAQPPRPDT